MAVTNLYPTLDMHVTTYSNPAPSAYTLTVGTSNLGTPHVYYETLIKFDMSQIPRGAVITGAVLRMYASILDRGSFGPIAFYRNTSDFNIDTRMNTKPTINEGSKKTFPVPEKQQWAGFDILSMLDTVNLSNNSYGFSIRSNDNQVHGSVTFARSGNPNPPYLEVTYYIPTAPTTPGAFTQPTGTLEIGDAKVFSVGASSDAENNLAKYVWEESLNGGAYTKVTETTAPSLSYTIPAATNLKMRVKAVDATGLESGYRESAVYPISKPIYYWSKYNAVPILEYADNAPWSVPSYGKNSVFLQAFKGFTFDPVTNTYNVAGSKFSLGEVMRPDTPGYFVNPNNGNLHKHTVDFDSYVDLETQTYLSYKKPAQNTQVVKGYNRSDLVQSGITAVADTYPLDGRHSDGFWYVRGSRVNQSIAPPSTFSLPITGKKFKPNEVANFTFGASNAVNLSLYEVDYRYNSTGTWTPLAYNNTLSRSLTITTDKTFKTLELRVRAKNASNVYSDYIYSEPFEIEHNVAPTVTITGPGENSTLYENDTLNIAGAAYDANPDQSVTVFYQINSEPRKVLATNLSQMQIALSKQLTFKGGKLYDGETVLTGTLADGVAHTLKVWAEDSEKASSAIVERTFYVVPNRAPLLTVDAVVPSGVVDADKFKISGTSSDQDANTNVTVTRRVNSGNAVEIYNGPGGAWEFEVSLAQLQVGENTIVVEVIDNYGAKTSKTIKLNKDEVKTPILQSVARYMITPPKGSAKGVLLFIERDVDLDLTAELSMTLTGEQEQYVTLTPEGTAPMPNQTGIVEDTYYYEADEPKSNIILKLSTSRPDATVNHKIHLISGAVD